MDHQLEVNIVEFIRTKVAESGSYSIKDAADKFFYYNISLSEQKHLAKLIVKSHPFVTEKKNREIIVRRNNLYEGQNGAGDSFGIMKAIAAAIVALLCYLVFDLFLKSL